MLNQSSPGYSLRIEFAPLSRWKTRTPSSAVLCASGEEPRSLEIAGSSRAGRLPFVSARVMRLLVALLVLCTAPHAVWAINRENPKGFTVEIISRRYLADPDVTFHSYAATGIVGGCSATLIGPNTVMTAAHCGFNASLFAFVLYREMDFRQPQIETVRCNPLYQTFADTDLHLLYCPPINGVNPGDKYGYLDFDARSPMVGESVYSVWKNPVDNLGRNEQMLYSDGRVVSLKAPTWATPTGFDNTATETNLWGRVNASGSSQISSKSHRVLVGPLSEAPSGNGGPLRRSLSIYDYLTRASVSTRANINAREIQTHGLDPADYLGGVDKDGNLLFDVQEDIEWEYGEGKRDHYALNFASERQNALWTTFAPWTVPSDFRPKDQSVHLPATGGVGQSVALRHEKLNLKPNTTYRISLMVHANTTIRNGLEVSLDGLFGKFGWGPVDSHSISLTRGTGWQMASFELSTSFPVEHALSISKLPGTDAFIAAINVIEEDSIMDFDTHDKRLHWRNDNNGARAFILPDGTGSGADWAALVGRTDSIAQGKDWPLRSRQLALLPQRSHRICFAMRKFRGHPASPITGYVRVKSNNSVVMTQTFSAQNSSWSSVCTDNFRTIGSDNIVQFGIYAPRPDQKAASGASFLVDDIQVILE